LAILPVPPEKAEIARKKVRRSGSKRQHKVGPCSTLAAGFMMLATSLPADIPASEICAVYRLRWHIELAFKRFKSLIRIDRIPTQTEAGGPELALSASHPRPADRRHLPGNPGIFPLWAVLTTLVCLRFGPSRPLLSTSCEPR
jgi:hypothetical protein